MCGTVDLLADFNGTTSTQITVPDMSQYKQIMIGIQTLGNYNGPVNRNVIGTAIIPRSSFVTGGMLLKAYGGNESTWGSIQSIFSNTSLICNRTSATTTHMGIWGIR